MAAAASSAWFSASTPLFQQQTNNGFHATMVPQASRNADLSQQTNNGFQATVVAQTTQSSNLSQQTRSEFEATLALQADQNSNRPRKSSSSFKKTQINETPQNISTNNNRNNSQLANPELEAVAVEALLGIRASSDNDATRYKRRHKSI